MSRKTIIMLIVAGLIIAGIVVGFVELIHAAQSGGGWHGSIDCAPNPGPC